jgi:hypothetical protein
MSHVENRNPTRFSQGSVGKEPRDESCGSKPRSTALRAHVGRRTMSSRERKGGEGQEVVCFVTCRDHAYYCTCTCTSYYIPNTCTRTYLARPVCKSDTSTRTVETFQTKYSHTETKSRRALGFRHFLCTEVFFPEVRVHVRKYNYFRKYFQSTKVRK